MKCSYLFESKKLGLGTIWPPFFFSLVFLRQRFFFVKVVLERMCIRERERHRNREKEKREKERGYAATVEK